MTAHDTAAASTTLKRTPLYGEHRALGARIVEFSGFEMPVQYTSIIEEHRAVRTHAGLFDVSHMGEFKVEGPDALAFLQHLVPNDVSRLAIHQALYTQLCLPNGGTVDDLIIYHLAENHYMLVVNAGNIDKDFAWVQEQTKNFNVQVINQSDTTALLALQGPDAQSILQPLTKVDLAGIRYYHFEPGVVDGVDCIISRTGYTGEDGFELYKRNFIGHDALLKAKAEGLKRKLIGIEMIERGIPRGGYAIYDNDRQIGTLTSGAPSPTLNKNIGMGYVDAADAVIGKPVQIDIRGKRTAAQIVALPFYKRKK